MKNYYFSINNLTIEERQEYIKALDLTVLLSISKDIIRSNMLNKEIIERNDEVIEQGYDELYRNGFIDIVVETD